MTYRVVGALVILGFTASWAVPQVPLGAEFQVNTYTTNSQFRASVASDLAGNFVVVWNSFQDGSDEGVFAQRYDALGAPRGSEFQVNTYTTGRQAYPQVASDAAGNFVVVWTSGAQYLSGYGVFAQRYDASGTPRGAEFRVNTYTTDDQQGGTVASDPAGNFIITWGSRLQDGDSFGVFGQRYDASGAPRGGEFRVSTYTTGSQCCGGSVASDAAGNFVVTWTSGDQDGSSVGVFAQRYDASGVPRGSEFRLSVNTSGPQAAPNVASDSAGNFVVTWHSAGEGYGQGFDVVARRFDSSGAPLGAEFRVNDYRPWHQVVARVAVDAAGSFVVAWEDGYNGVGYDIFAQRFDAAGVALGPNVRVNSFLPAWQRAAAVASTGPAAFVVVWTSSAGFGNTEQDGSGAGVFGQRLGGTILPVALAVDTAPSGGSDGNRVFEPGEAVDVRTSWRNVTGASQTFDGTGLSFSGPGANGVGYQLLDGVGAYGTVADDATVTCSDCYEVGVTFGGTRPSSHWDATLTERLTPSGPTTPWSIHVGGSFVDVPKTSLYYRDVETLLHRGVTAGCASGVYCPTSPTTREQMAAFVLLGREGAGYVPYWCSPPDMFADVPNTSPFCDVIEELARRGVVAGCGGGNYCPAGAVAREQMPVFVLRTLDPAFVPPACTTPLFTDVPASSPFCPWIEELARRGVVAGCGGGRYCPADPVTREQMAVFLTGTFGLSLYGP